MKKIFTAVFTFLIISQGIAQIQPVTNILWNHIYQNPLNCFNLSWNVPATSATDTLVGYNVYRGNTLYKFLTGTHFSCYPCIGDTSTAHCNFIYYNNGNGFYMHVKAVYNSNHEESTHSDSAHCQGIALSINDNIEKSVKIFPNPTTGILHIEMDGLQKVTILNGIGMLTKEYPSVKEINLNTFPKGMYFIQLETLKGIYTRKVIYK